MGHSPFDDKKKDEIRGDKRQASLPLHACKGNALREEKNERILEENMDDCMHFGFRRDMFFDWL